MPKSCQFRHLTHTWFPYVFCDATYVKVRLHGRVTSQAVVVATGVSIDGRREILGHAVGDAETETFWVEFLRTLRERGLAIAGEDRLGVQLVISDGHRGLRNAIGQVMPGAAWQRCRVHWERNELSMACCGVDDRPIVGQSLSDGCRRVAVLGESWADFADDVADGSPADFEQFGECVL